MRTIPIEEHRFKSQSNWKANNQKKVWAHSALRSALRRQLLEQKPCEVCSDPASEAHHPDYDRPMDVVWLCRKCHKAEYRRMKCEAAQ